MKLFPHQVTALKETEGRNKVAYYLDMGLGNMALGGGTFTAQNKVLPGAYINFISLAAASATLSDRGIAAIGIESDWGETGKVFTVTSADFQKYSQKIFGYSYENEKLKGLRDLFSNIHTLHVYRLNGNGVKAANAFATAKYSGTRGNDIKIVIQKNVDEHTKFDVQTVLGTSIVDIQTVATVNELKSNDYIEFKSDAVLAVTAATPLTGGTNSNVDGSAHQDFLDKLEKFSFNALGCTATEDTIKGLYINYCKRLRDEMGKKFQVIIYNKPADYEGVVNVKNAVTDGNEGDLVFWVTGIIAGTPVNKSALNKIYSGEFEVNVDFTQSQLESAIKSGEFTLHQVGDEVRVLMDINSLITTSSTKGDVFKDNQTIRVIDQIANDIAVLFNTKYLGVVPNDAAGRISLWSDVVQHHNNLQAIRAIENFADTDVIVAQGETKKAVIVTDLVTVVNTMEKLYMTMTIK